MQRFVSLSYCNFELCRQPTHSLYAIIWRYLKELHTNCYLLTDIYFFSLLSNLASVFFLTIFLLLLLFVVLFKNSISIMLSIICIKQLLAFCLFSLHLKCDHENDDRSIDSNRLDYTRKNPKAMRLEKEVEEFRTIFSLFFASLSIALSELDCILVKKNFSG